MKRIKDFFLLKDDAFFDMLVNLAEVTQRCSVEFERFVSDYERLDAGQRGVRLKSLNGYEKDGDILVRTIWRSKRFSASERWEHLRPAYRAGGASLPIST